MYAFIPTRVYGDRQVTLFNIWNVSRELTSPGARTLRADLDVKARSSEATAGFLHIEGTAVARGLTVENQEVNGGTHKRRYIGESLQPPQPFL